MQRGLNALLSGRATVLGTHRSCRSILWISVVVRRGSGREGAGLPQACAAQGLPVDRDGESTAAVRVRVLAARAAATERWAGHGWLCNAEVRGPALRSRFALPGPVLRPLDAGLRSGELTARSAAGRRAWGARGSGTGRCPQLITSGSRCVHAGAGHDTFPAGLPGVNRSHV
jgi:hypothetical protein